MSTTSGEPPVDGDLIRRYLDHRDEDQRQLGQLEGATERLTEEVGGLRTALSTYKQEVDRIGSTTVKRTEYDKDVEQRLRDLVALRLRIRRRANIMFIIAISLLAVACGTFAYVLHYEAQQRRDACVTRNNGAKAALPFYDKQIANLERRHSDPAVIGVLQAARLAAQKSIVHC